MIFLKFSNSVNKEKIKVDWIYVAVSPDNQNMITKMIFAIIVKKKAKSLFACILDCHSAHWQMDKPLMTAKRWSGMENRISIDQSTREQGQ